MYKLSVVVVTILLMAGCAALRPPLSPTPEAVPPVSDSTGSSQCNNLLDNYETFSRMDTLHRNQELETVAGIWSVTQESCDQLRLALLLSQPETSVQDKQKSLKLLTELLAGKPSLDMQARQLANLLSDQLNQAQSRQVQILELRYQLEQKNAASQRLSKQLTSLQSQLEQLKSIEKSINEKEQSIITPSSNSISDEPAQNPPGR